MIALSLGRCKPLSDGAVLRLRCVNRDRAGQAAGPATSAMPRKRRLAVKMSPVAKGQKRSFGLTQSCSAAPRGFRRRRSLLKMPHKG